MNANNDPVPLPLKDDMSIIIAEMTSNDNCHYTSEEVHHIPTRNELALHYIEHGGLEHHRQTHRIAA